MKKWLKREMEDQEGTEKRSWKRTALLWGGLIVAILVVGFLYMQEGKEPEKPTKPKEESEQVFKEKTGYDERLRKVIQEENYAQNQGTIADGFKYNEEYYLTINQSGVFAYNEDFPGDTLLWVKEKEGKVESKQLNGGDKLLQLVMNKETPFFEQEGKTYIVFYEKEGNEEMGHLSKGYVYEIQKDGNIQLHYETKGHFYDASKGRDGRLVIIEKVFVDTLNLYPMELKDYKLKSYQLKEDEWAFLNEKAFYPSEELNQTEEETDKKSE